MILSTGCIGEPSTKTDSFKTRPSFLNVYLCADRLISDNESDSTYCYALRRLLDRDSSALADISQSAADNPEHAYLLAAYYYREGDYESMLQYLKTAAARLPQARCDLGLCHQLGIGTRRDPQLAQKRFEEASAKGCIEADYYLIRPEIFGALYRYYATDMIDRDNVATIIERLHRPADSGCARACYYLGVMYYLLSAAESTPQSETKAMKYLTSAAHSGIPEAIEMVNEYNATNMIRKLQYAFIIDNSDARNAYLQGSYLYIESIYEPHKKKRKDMQAAAIDYMRTASELGIHQATEMLEEYASTKHIYRLEHFNTQIIGNDNYALSDDGHIILN